MVTRITTGSFTASIGAGQARQDCLTWVGTANPGGHNMSPFRRERPPVCLGPLTSFPEDVPKRIGTSPPLAILRHGDTVHVFEDRCPHAGAILSRGTLTGEHLTCPAHAATFEVATGRSLGPLACRPLRTYTAWLEDGLLYHSPIPRPPRKAQRAPCPTQAPTDA